MRRELSGNWVWVVRIIAITLALFHIYTAATMPLPTMQQRSIHVALGFALILASWSPLKGEKAESKIAVYDLVLIGLILAACINAFVNMEFWFTHLMSTSNTNLFLGICTILLAVETSRRTVGWVFPILVTGFLLYALFGNCIPGKFGHPGLEWEHLVVYLYQSDFGIWGFITGISATIVAMFLIFGAFLLFTGGGDAFMDLAKKAAGRIAGGPALVAVVGSGLFGTISGTSVANVATTGSFTIPLMKNLGYKPSFAGGVESVASTGGQIAPPIMGAGAFVMAELLGISYIKVIIAAIIPALLYYVAVFLGVFFEAKRIKLAAMPQEQIPPWRDILIYRRLAPFILPICVLLYLVAVGYSVTRGCFWAIVIATVIYVFSGYHWQSMKERLKNVVYGLERGGMAITLVVSLLVCANIIVAVLTQTGLGAKITEVILGVSGQSFILALVLTAVCAIVLGMGMSTTAAYVLGASILSSALLKLGMLPLQAHLFIFYFCILSAITPPVCVAVYTAAGIARTSWLPVAWVAMKLGVIAYIIPFAFAYEPALILMGSPLTIVQCAITAVIGAGALAVAISGYFTSHLGIVTRAILFAAGILLLVPSWQTDIWGVGAVCVAVISQVLILRLVSQRRGKLPTRR